MAAKDQDAFGSFPPVLVNNMSLAAMYSMPRVSVLFIEWLDTTTKMRLQASSRTWLSRYPESFRELLIENCRFTVWLWNTEALCGKIWQKQLESEMYAHRPSTDEERFRLVMEWGRLALRRRLICRQIRARSGAQLAR